MSYNEGNNSFSKICGDTVVTLEAKPLQSQPDYTIPFSPTQIDNIMAAMFSAAYDNDINGENIVGKVRSVKEIGDNSTMGICRDATQITLFSRPIYEAIERKTHWWSFRANPVIRDQFPASIAIHEMQHWSDFYNNHPSVEYDKQNPKRLAPYEEQMEQRAMAAQAKHMAALLPHLVGKDMLWRPYEQIIKVPSLEEASKYTEALRRWQKDSKPYEPRFYMHT